MNSDSNNFSDLGAGLRDVTTEKMKVSFGQRRSTHRISDSPFAFARQDTPQDVSGFIAYRAK
jgi:hypothetical protein